MARISRRGFNNIVIFAMLAMIFLFNLDRFIPAAKQPVVQPLLPSDMFVLKIEQSGQKLERVGQNWRWSGVNQVLASSPDTQIEAWRNAVIELSKAPRDVIQTEPLITVVWVAGNTHGLVYAFVPTANELWLKQDNNWFVIKHATIAELLPWVTNKQAM